MADRSNSKKVDSAAIEKRAYEIFLERGAEHGNHIEHWLVAEAELRNEQNRDDVAGRGLPDASNDTQTSKAPLKSSPRKRVPKL